MPAPGSWMLCRRLTDDSIAIDCQHFTAPPMKVDPDWMHPVIHDLGLLQDFLSQLTDQRLKMELTIGMDEQVARIGAQLPAGYEFRRAADHDDPGDPGVSLDGEPVSVPDVVGLYATEGYKVLRELGYDVAEAKEIGSAGVDLIVSQDPPGDSPIPPPLTVTITVTWPPPHRSSQPPPDPTTIPPPGFGS